LRSNHAALRIETRRTREWEIGWRRWKHGNARVSVGWVVWRGGSSLTRPRECWCFCHGATQRGGWKNTSSDESELGISLIKDLMGYMVPAVHGLVCWMWMLTAINSLALAFPNRYSFFHYFISFPVSDERVGMSSFARMIGADDG
jgi:hypothetical protein